MLTFGFFVDGKCYHDHGIHTDPMGYGCTIPLEVIIHCSPSGSDAAVGGLAASIIVTPSESSPRPAPSRNVEVDVPWQNVDKIGYHSYNNGML